MDATNFCYWLQGFAELNDQPPTLEQWQSIREHLQLVFTKVTPPVKSPDYGPNPNPLSPNIGRPPSPYLTKEQMEEAQRYSKLLRQPTLIC